MLEELTALTADHMTYLGLLLVFLAGVVRGFAGFGSGMIYVPVAAALFGPKVAAATLLLYDFPIALPMTFKQLPHANIREVIPLAIGGFLMTPVGYLALEHADPTLIRWVMSLSVLIALALIASGWRFRGKSSDLQTATVGGVSGFFNGLAQMGSPPIILFWLSKEMAPRVMRASALLYYLTGSCVTFVTYYFGGLLTQRVVLLSALMVPVFGIAMTIGSSLFGKTSVETYRKIAYGLIALSGISGLPLWVALH